jgi:hypothetical protein
MDNSKKASFTLKGCVILKDEIYVNLKEVKRLCESFSSYSGKQLASYIDLVLKSEDKRKSLPVVNDDPKKGLLEKIKTLWQKE